MKILVTGAGGFLGSALAASLGRSHDVVALDHGRHYPLLEPLMPPRVKLVKGDIGDERLLDGLLPGVDTIAHLAGVAGDRLCKDDPVKAVASNIVGTHLLLDRAARHKVGKFVFSSSYWVYSFYDDRPMPLRETDELRTDSFYGALKAASEREITDSASPYIIARLATVYGYGTGVGAQWRGLIGKFIQASFKGGPMTMYGDGSQGLDLIHVDDAVAALTALIVDASVSRQIVNIGGGAVKSIRDIAAIVKRHGESVFGLAPVVSTLPAPPGKIWPDRYLAIDSIRRRLPSFPATSLEDGILDMMRKFKETRA